MQRSRTSDRLRRLTRRFIICLLLGAALQYLVAAGFGCSGSWGREGRMWAIKVSDVSDAFAVGLGRVDSVGREILSAKFARNSSDASSVHPRSEPDWSQSNWVDFLRSSSGELEYGETLTNDLPSWSRIARVNSEPDFDYYPPSLFFATNAGWCLEVGCGWPCCSASYFAAEPIPGGQYLVRDAMLISSCPAGQTVTPRAIPLRIHWRGTLVNSFVYATILLIPFTLIPLTRRHLRRRAGHCPACDYDLRGANHAICPECGSPQSIRKPP